MGAPYKLECVPCSNEEGLWQFRRGESVASRVDPEWIDPSRQGQIVPTGSVGWSHPDNYGVPQFLDASTIGLGAILYQEQDGKDRVITYASRVLSKSESHYPAHKLEFLAL